MPGGWQSLGLQPEILRAVQQLDWKLPTDVQDEAIPLMLGGGDVMVAAETGSGKTAAFGLPIVQIVFESLRAEKRQETAKRSGSTATEGTIALNPHDKSTIVRIDSDGVTCEAIGVRSWGGVRSTYGVVRGAHYFEVEMLQGELGRVGWSTLAASFDLGYDANGFGFGGTAKKSTKKNFVPYGSRYGPGDVVGCYINVDARRIGFTLNGRDLGVAFDVPSSLKGALFPSVCLKNAAMKLNFGATPFKFSPPSKSKRAYRALSAARSGEVARSALFSVSAAGSRPQRRRTPMAMVLAPTKDLAEQIYKSIRTMTRFCTDPQIRIALVMGGDVRKAQAMLSSGPGVDIVIGTPGRTLDFVRRGLIDVTDVRLLVLDEADRLCDFEGMKSIAELFDRLPKFKRGGDSRLQVCFFSATLHSDAIRKLAAKICEFPQWVDLKGRETTVPETVRHFIVWVNPDDAKQCRKLLEGKDARRVVTDDVHPRNEVKKGRDDAESRSERIKRMKPILLKGAIDALKMDQCIIFCRTNLDCDNLETFLTAVGGGRKFRPGQLGGKENPYSCAVLGGSRSMSERRANLEAFKNGDVRFLIATDVAARGVDIKGLPFCVNLTMPDVSENYVHRVGRVGRAGRVGLALSFVATCQEKVWYYDKRKWKGRKKLRTLANIDKHGRPVSGGCCTWYDEPKILKDIEARVLKRSVPILPCQLDEQRRLKVPPDVADGTYGQSSGAGGSFDDEDDGRRRKADAASRREAVRRLAELESKAQMSFFGAASRFGVSRE